MAEQGSAKQKQPALRKEQVMLQRGIGEALLSGQLGASSERSRLSVLSVQ